ncbi:hypothetical protein, partial [Paraburkholderia phenoliruptrix]|uniref:hypothetical protein n=1 Tax=Paraburkholderia phenoliruptrix TaxID=252970 RepID=UPI001C6F3305
RQGRAVNKKKARRRGDAPSNKRYGNCLLGFHCSQKALPENRASIGFPAVAGRQQEFYAHLMHKLLWTACGSNPGRACSLGLHRPTPFSGGITP